MPAEVYAAEQSVVGRVAKGASAIEVQRHECAKVARCTVTRPGADLAARLAVLEQELQADQYVLIQLYGDLGKSWSGGVVEQLRSQGYALGGLLPIWFGADGLLMQKHFVAPNYEGMNIYSDRGRALVALVRTDWERSGTHKKSHING